MAATDSKPVPIKNAAYRIYFPVYKNDGTIITGWTGAAATISKDSATSGSATNSPVEIASSWGIGYLDLTSTEMNVDCLVVKITLTNTGALPQVLALYPQEAGDIQVNPTYWNGSAVATPNVSGVPLVDNGYWRGTQPNTLQSGRVDSYIGAIASGVIAAASFAANALDAVWSTTSRTLTAFSDSSGITTLLSRIASTLTITGGKVDVNDKTGFALTAGEHTNIATDAQTGLTAQGYTTTRAGYLDILNGLLAAIWGYATRTLTAASDSSGVTTLLSRIASALTITGGKVDVNDKTGFSLTSTEHTSIATDAQTGLTAQGYTTTRAGYLDTLNGLVTAIWASGTRTLTAISDSSGVTTLLSRIASALTITGGKVDVNDKTGFSLATAPPTAAAIADAVWDEAISGHTTAGSTGEALINANPDNATISDISDLLVSITENSGGNQFTAHALAQAPTGGSVDVNAIADAVLDELLADHTISGSLSQIIALIYAKASLITSDNVTYTSPVNPITGNMDNLYQSVDYTPDSGQIMPSWDSDAWLPFSLTTADNITWYIRKTKGGAIIAQGSVTALADNSIQIQTLSHDKTDNLLVSKTDKDTYSLQIWAILDADHGNAEEILLDKLVLVRDDIRS